jgi:uncharacterized protein (TIGR03435 family)
MSSEYPYAGGTPMKLNLAPAAVAAIAWIGAIAPAEQAAPTQDPREQFEVASIRPNLPTAARAGRVPLRVPPGSFCNGDAPQVAPNRVVLNGALYTLISMAYSLDCVSLDGTAPVSGGPEWVKSDQWAIQAVIPEAAGLLVAPEECRSVCRAWISDARVQRMLRNLLAERFKLVLHRETKEVPVYALTVANGGPKLQHSDDAPCTLPGDSPVKPSGTPNCTLALRNASMAKFAASIVLLDRPVVDKTGITGNFDFRLIFDSRQSLLRLGTDPSDSTGPSIFTALQQQLGLKLESSKARVEVLVIDRVEKPSEN